MTIDKFEGSYRFLSNFWEVPIEFDGETYPSVEHAYQAAKTVDPISRLQIRSAPTAAKAKKLGQKVLIRPNWESIKLQVMGELVHYKFKNHHMLLDALKQTFPDELVEGNWWGDTYWGVCKGVGENHLGKILMKIREELV